MWVGLYVSHAVCCIVFVSCSCISSCRLLLNLSSLGFPVAVQKTLHKITIRGGLQCQERNKDKVSLYYPITTRLLVIIYFYVLKGQSSSNHFGWPNQKFDRTLHLNR